MRSRSFAHWARMVLGGLLLAACGAAGARHVLDLDVNRQPARLQDWGDYLIAPGDASAVAVLNRKSRMVPTLPAGTPYPLREGQALWIRIAVPATPDEQRWYLQVASPGLDSVALYTLGRDEAWTRQVAGDVLPVGAWPIPYLYPVLPIAVSPAEPTYYLLRIQSVDGFAGPIEFISESGLAGEQQRLSLLFGACFGLLSICALLATASGIALRDTAYLWFGVWAAFATVAAMSLAGVAGAHLWPQWQSWNDKSQYVLPVLACAPFLLFVAEATLLRERARALFWSVVVFACAALLCAGVVGWASGKPRLVLALLSGLVVALIAVGITVRAWRLGDHFALGLLLAFTPVVLALAIQSACLLDWLPRWAWGPYIAMGCVGLSMVAGYLVLALRSQDKRDQHRRVARLAEIDPTTGLANDVVFGRELAETIARAKRLEHKSVAAIVEFTNFAELQKEFGRDKTAAMLLRLGERLTSMLRNVDMVARVGDARFGLLIEGPLAPSRARSFCAKVIAHCITPLSGLPQGMVNRPKIVVVLVPDQNGSAAGVMQRLDAMLREAARDPGRSIVIADQEPDSGPSSVAPSPTSQPATGGDEWQSTSASQ